MMRKIFIVIIFIFIAIQFFRPVKNISAQVSQNDIVSHYNVPDDVLHILKRACYDCHSNNTIYPWYNNIQPVAWWMADHVKVGKEEINFSEFASYEPKKQRHKLNEVIWQVKKDEMPLDSYLWIHKDAKLNETQKNAVIAWADSLQKMIALKNNLPAEEEREQEHER
ncbi:MAG: heme-binding domain-containing protein [Bacteroidetes bacterium]|nr:heme-binding domain-containing protein [Bacteroidota bacterium]